MKFTPGNQSLDILDNMVCFHTIFYTTQQVNLRTPYLGPGRMEDVRVEPNLESCSGPGEAVGALVATVPMLQDRISEIC